MWQPRAFGVLIGWAAAIFVAIYFLSDELMNTGLLGEECIYDGLSSWNCGLMPRLVIALPNTFVYFLQLPFNYDAAWDVLGAQFTLMIVGSTIAYGLALVAVNYWVWKLNQL